jgi:ABC-2 type transport system permease protein
MALGFGALYADFKAENRDASMGPGAILFLLSALLYELIVLGLGVIPSYRLVKKGLQTSEALPFSEMYLISLWLLGSSVISLLLVFVICRVGIRRLKN